VNAIVPQVLADQLRGFALMVPQEAQWPAFAVLLTIYVFAAVKLICLIYCWLDYVVATATRRLGFSPVGIQYSLGNALEKLPRWTARAGWLFMLITVAWAVLAYGAKLPDNSPLMSFQVQWGRILRALWG
jgi:hypothetical protein